MVFKKLAKYKKKFDAEADDFRRDRIKKLKAKNKASQKRTNLKKALKREEAKADSYSFKGRLKSNLKKRGKKAVSNYLGKSKPKRKRATKKKGRTITIRL